MAEITAAAVKALRDKLNLPMMEVKRALTEAGGDEEKAIAILKEQFKKVQVKRAENTTSEGRIAIAISADTQSAAMVELQCESAPVASNDGFLSLARQCANQLLNGPGAETPDQLLDQPAPEAAGKTLRAVWEDLTNQIREKIVLARIIKVSGTTGGYVHHDGKNACLLVAEGSGGKTDVLRDVAMHVTALRPLCTHPEELNADVVSAERAKLVTEAKASGKPENIVEKIVDGKMKTFYNEQGVLTFQPFAKDDSKLVSQALAESGYKAKSFVRWTLGN